MLLRAEPECVEVDREAHLVVVRAQILGYLPKSDAKNSQEQLAVEVSAAARLARAVGSD